MNGVLAQAIAQLMGMVPQSRFGYSPPEQFTLETIRPEMEESAMPTIHPDMYKYLDEMKQGMPRWDDVEPAITDEEMLRMLNEGM